MKCEVRVEKILPPLCDEIAADGDEMPLLPGVRDELATHHRHHSLRHDSHHFSVQVLLVTV
jgi:hypothetical protein